MYAIPPIKCNLTSLEDLTSMTLTDSKQSAAMKFGRGSLYRGWGESVGVLRSNRVNSGSLEAGALIVLNYY